MFYQNVVRLNVGYHLSSKLLPFFKFLRKEQKTITLHYWITNCFLKKTRYEYQPTEMREKNKTLYLSNAEQQQMQRSKEGTFWPRSSLIYHVIESDFDMVINYLTKGTATEIISIHARQEIKNSLQIKSADQMRKKKKPSWILGNGVQRAIH